MTQTDEKRPGQGALQNSLPPSVAARPDVTPEQQRAYAAQLDLAVEAERRWAAMGHGTRSPGYSNVARYAALAGVPDPLAQQDAARRKAENAKRLKEYVKKNRLQRPEPVRGEDGTFTIPTLDRETMTEREREIHANACALGSAKSADDIVLAHRAKAARGGGSDQFSMPQQELERTAALTGIRSKLMKLSELAALPPTRPLIKGILDLDSESWLIGQSGGFKSFVAVDWACHVAAGAPLWRGRKVTAGDVLYVVAEGARGFAKRVTAWGARHGVSPDRLSILPMPVQARGASNRDLSGEWLALIEVAAELKPALVVLDTQARMTVGLEENSATDMGLWVKAVDDLKAATGACVLVVHHTGRNGGDARGSSAIDAAQDMEWKVERKPGQLRATLRCDKSKDGDDRQRFAFSMEVVPVGRDEDGDEITSLVLGDEVDTGLGGQQGIAVLETIAAEGESLTNQEWILRTLKVSEPVGQGMSQAELARLVNGARKRAEPAVEPMNPNTYKTTIKRLLDAGQLYKRGQRVSTTDPAQDAAEDAEWLG